MKSKKINILLPSFGIEPIGGFKIAYIYANYLAATGWKVYIIHTLNGKNRRITEQWTTFIEQFFRIQLGEKNWFQFRKGITCRYVSRFSKLTVPQADITMATAWTTARDLEALKIGGKKIYLIQHYEIWNGTKKDVDATWKYKDMYKIVISKWLMKIGEELHCENLTYIPNAISHSKYQKKISDKDRTTDICMLYSDNKFKDAKTGIEVLKSLKKEFPNLKVKLFGTAQRNVRIPRWIKYYVNPQQDRLVDEIYNDSKIFLCTSIVEGWGLPPMEAMGCGCAVVTTNNGGVGDFAIDEETALVTKVRDVQEIVNAVKELLMDESKRRCIADKGNRYVKNFTWKDSFYRMDMLLNKLLKET